MTGKGKLVVISGPSGAGKTTIVKRVMERTGTEFSVSATTRQPRPAEADGREYHFVSRPDFEKMIAAGELLEWAEVFGQLYGTPAGPVAEAVDRGRTVLLDVDVQGGKQVHDKMPSATFVLVVPPGRRELAERLVRRNTEAPDDLTDRLAKADAEIAAAKESGFYSHVVVNDDLEQAVDQIVDIVNQ